MKFLKKSREALRSNDWKMQDWIVKRIAGFISSLQVRFASGMDMKVNKMSIVAKKFCLAIFSVLYAGLSIYILTQALFKNDESTRRIQPTRLSIPKYYDQVIEKSRKRTVSERSIIRINYFRRYMDSLKFSEKGKQVYDSILMQRPGLMDSIKTIEEFYYSQSK